jgi:hypothetical protein
VGVEKHCCVERNLASFSTGLAFFNINIGDNEKAKQRAQEEHGNKKQSFFLIILIEGERSGQNRLAFIIELQYRKRIIYKTLLTQLTPS